MTEPNEVLSLMIQKAVGTDELYGFAEDGPQRTLLSVVHLAPDGWPESERTVAVWVPIEYVREWSRNEREAYQL